MSKEKDYLGKATNEAGKTFIIKVVSYGVAFISQIIFTRALGADLVGLYQICMNIIMLSMMISVLGMDSSNIKFISQFYSKKDYSKVKSYFYYSIKMTMILSIICSITLLVFRDKISLNIFNDGRINKVLPVFCLILIMYALIEVIGGYSRGIKRSSDYFLSQEFINKFVKIIVFILLYLFGVKFIGLVIGTILGFACSLIYLLYKVKKATPELFDNKIEKTDINYKEYWKYSISMSTVYFTNYLMVYVNSTIIGIFLNSENVGVYSNAQTLASFIIFIYVSFNSIFVSMVSELWASGKVKVLRVLYIDITRIILVLSIPLVVIMIYYSDTILGIFGEEFKRGSSAFIILIIGQLFNIIVGPNESLLSMSGNQRYSMINGIMIAMLNIILNIVLIPIYGIVGSAMAGAVAIIVVNIIKTIQVKKQLNILPYDRSIIKVVFVTFIIVIFVGICKIFVKNNIFTLAIIGVITYITSLVTYYFLGLSEGEINIIKSFNKKFKRKY